MAMQQLSGRVPTCTYRHSGENAIIVFTSAADHRSLPPKRKQAPRRPSQEDTALIRTNHNESLLSSVIDPIFQFIINRGLHS